MKPTTRLLGASIWDAVYDVFHLELTTNFSDSFCGFMTDEVARETLMAEFDFPVIVVGHPLD